MKGLQRAILGHLEYIFGHPQHLKAIAFTLDAAMSEQAEIYLIS